MLLFLQSSSVPADSSVPATPPQTVELSAAQMAEIGAQINGAALWLGALLAVLVICMGTLMLVTVLGGR